MKEYKYHYTYLIKNLNPSSDLQFYVGVKSCNVLPQENTNYMGSSKLLTNDIKLHGPRNFQKIILEEFDSREEAEVHENSIHVTYDAASNPQFYNKKNGIIGFHVTADSTANMLQTKSSQEWLETQGKEQSRKMKETKANDIWKETKGKEQSQKHAETLNDPEWLATVGKEAACKRSETVNDSNWIETCGKDKSRKIKDTKNSAYWKEAHTHICPHCNKSIFGRGNLTQHIQANHMLPK